MLRRGNQLSDANNHLISAYISEYQVMQSRIIRFITMQIGVWVSFVVVLSFLLKIYDDHMLSKSLFYWGVSLAIIGTAQIYYFALHEVYNHTLYVENILRQKISRILIKKSILGWEKHLKGTGRASPSYFGDFVFVFPPIGWIIYSIYKISPCWSHLDYFMLSVSIFCLLIFPFQGAIRAYNIRKRFERSC